MTPPPQSRHWSPLRRTRWAMRTLKQAPPELRPERLSPIVAEATTHWVCPDCGMPCNCPTPNLAHRQCHKEAP